MADATHQVVLGDLLEGTSLETATEALRDRSVLVLCSRMMPVVKALIELDGIARRIVLCPPDVTVADLPAIVATAEIDVVLSDCGERPMRLPPSVASIGIREAPVRPALPIDRNRPTEWVLFTSGTTNRPKMVVHTLSSLIGPLDDALTVTNDAVWTTFYDIRRYGGLQILLRGLLGGGSMLLGQADETIAAFLGRAGRFGVTHISGTPSHWRRVLMSTAAGQISPSYVRLSGEVADQAILGALARAYPRAEIAHAFASTEAGVAFAVRDGLAGFPATWVGGTSGAVDLRVDGGSLSVRSARAASHYLGDNKALADADGFIDTGDMLELRSNRYYFIGRRDAVINVGGQKVHPEEVEAVINQHPWVQLSRVSGRTNPISGAIVVADVVVRPSGGQDGFEEIKAEILKACKLALPAHKIPVSLRQVVELPTTTSGKLDRSYV